MRDYASLSPNCSPKKKKGKKRKPKILLVYNPGSKGERINNNITNQIAILIFLTWFGASHVLIQFTDGMTQVGFFL